MLDLDIYLVVAARAKPTATKLTKHERVFGEAVHKLMVVQIAESLELLTAHFALERRLHMTLHVATQPVLVVELLVADGTVERRVAVR